MSALYRDYKTDIWEDGDRMLFFVRLPGKIAPGAACDETICHNKRMATGADLRGMKMPVKTALAFGLCSVVRNYRSPISLIRLAMARLQSGKESGS